MSGTVGGIVVIGVAVALGLILFGFASAYLPSSGGASTAPTS